MRSYRGILIHRCNPNCSGCRWEALIQGRWFRAETLASMRQIIKEYAP